MQLLQLSDETATQSDLLRSVFPLSKRRYRLYLNIVGKPLLSCVLEKHLPFGIRWSWIRVISTCGHSCLRRVPSAVEQTSPQYKFDILLLAYVPARLNLGQKLPMESHLTKTTSSLCQTRIGESSAQSGQYGRTGAASNTRLARLSGNTDTKMALSPECTAHKPCLNTTYTVALPLWSFDRSTFLHQKQFDAQSSHYAPLLKNN